MLAQAGQSATRVLLAVVALVTVALLCVFAVVCKRYRAADAPSTLSQIVIIRAAAQQLVNERVVVCPTMLQVLDLTPHPRAATCWGETNGVDPWGTPFQIECRETRVRVFSAGPDKKPGTGDDVRISL